MFEGMFRYLYPAQQGVWSSTSITYPVYMTHFSHQCPFKTVRNICLIELCNAHRFVLNVLAIWHSIGPVAWELSDRCSLKLSSHTHLYFQYMHRV